MGVSKGAFASVSNTFAMAVMNLNASNQVHQFFEPSLTPTQFQIILNWLRCGIVMTPEDVRVRKIVMQKRAAGEHYNQGYSSTPRLYGPNEGTEPGSVEAIYLIDEPEKRLGIPLFDADMKQLIDVYVFATNWDIRPLRQAIMYKLEQLYDTCREWDALEAIFNLEKKLPASSPLVQLVLNCFARHCSLDARTDDDMQQLMTLSKEFLVEWLVICQHICRRRSGNLHCSRQDPYMENFDPCRWHEHGEDEKEIEELHKEQLQEWVEESMDRGE